MCNEIAPWLDCHQPNVDDVSTLGRVGGKGKGTAQPFPYSDCVCVYCLEATTWQLYKAFQSNAGNLESNGNLSQLAARREHINVIRSLWHSLYQEINDR